MKHKSVLLLLISLFAISTVEVAFADTKQYVYVNNSGGNKLVMVLDGSSVTSSIKRNIYCGLSVVFMQGSCSVNVVPNANTDKLPTGETVNKNTKSKELNYVSEVVQGQQKSGVTYVTQIIEKAVPGPQGPQGPQGIPGASTILPSSNVNIPTGSQYNGYSLQPVPLPKLVANVEMVMATTGATYLYTYNDGSQKTLIPPASDVLGNNATFTNLAVAQKTKLADVTIGNGTSSNFFSAVFSAVSAFFTNIFWQNATGNTAQLGNISATNVTATGTFVFASGTISFATITKSKVIDTDIDNAVIANATITNATATNLRATNVRSTNINSSNVTVTTSLNSTGSTTLATTTIASGQATFTNLAVTSTFLSLGTSTMSTTSNKLLSVGNDNDLGVIDNVNLALGNFYKLVVRGSIYLISYATGGTNQSSGINFGASATMATSVNAVVGGCQNTLTSIMVSGTSSPYFNCKPMLSSGASVGDVKYGYQSADHNGWVKMDGRALSSLTSTQQTAAATLGISGNLPNIADKNFMGVSGTKTLGSTGGSANIAQNQLPNVSLSLTGAYTDTQGNHTHNFLANDGNGGLGQGASINSPGAGYYGTSNNGYSWTQAAGNHSHNVYGNTTSLNGGVSQTAYAEPYLAVNGFIYLGQ